jgi:hypothetical protein
VYDPLVDAVSIVPGNVKAMNESQSRVVYFSCILDFLFPRFSARRRQSNFAALDAKA